MIPEETVIPFVICRPAVAGCWVVCGNVRIYVMRRPRWLARVMARWLLQWEWEGTNE